MEFCLCDDGSEDDTLNIFDTSNLPTSYMLHKENRGLRNTIIEFFNAVGDRGCDFIGIIGNDVLTNVDGLSALTSIEGSLVINGNATLTNLDGLGSLTDGGEYLCITQNDILLDCEVCDLLDQLTSLPADADIDVDHNLDDTCTPVPAGCP